MAVLLKTISAFMYIPVSCVNCGELPLKLKVTRRKICKMGSICFRELQCFSFCIFSQFYPGQFDQVCEPPGVPFSRNRDGAFK